MENIKRDLAKEIAALQSSKSARKNRHWTLLFVGNHGQVVTIRWFRWMVTLGLFLLVLAVLVGGLFYYLYYHTRNINEVLQRSLDNMHQQISGFRRDKEVLMAQLLVAETEMKRLQGRKDPKYVEKMPGNRPEELEKKEARLKSEVVRQDEAAVAGTEGKVISSAPSVESVDQENDPKVSIDEFKVLHEAADNTYRAQFVVRNTGPESQPVSGYTAIVLKNLDMQPDQWLPLPTLNLAAGVPTGHRVGQYFSISRFKAVRISVKSQRDPQQFDSATVYVFDEKKNVVLEKDFSITIQIH